MDETGLSHISETPHKAAKTLSVPEDELVSVALYREDLRQLLVAADLHQRDREHDGQARSVRLDLAIKRIGGSASSTEWQPTPRGDT